MLKCWKGKKKPSCLLRVFIPLGIKLFFKSSWWQVIQEMLYFYLMGPAFSTTDRLWMNRDVSTLQMPGASRGTNSPLPPVLSATRCHGARWRHSNLHFRSTFIYVYNSAENSTFYIKATYTIASAKQCQISRTEYVIPMLGTDKLFPALLSGTGTFMLRFPNCIPKQNILEKAVTNARSFTTGWVPGHTPVSAIKGVGYEYKGRMDPETSVRWLHTLMACGVTFHQMLHGDRHGIKARGDMGTSSWPGVVSLENEPDAIKSSGTVSSTDTLSSVPKNILFSFSSSNGIWSFILLLQDPRIS